MKTKVIKYDPTGRMFVYCWEDANTPGECKFGERWVPLGIDPEKSILFRIRQSMGVRKDIFDQGDITLIGYWNVTELAKKVHRCHSRSRMDDYLRAKIGYRKNSTGEVHLLSGIDMKIKVNQLMIKLEQPLMNVELSTKQYEIAEDVLEKFSDSQVILAELCARFGKTLWAGAIFKELGPELVIITSYVKTVFTSFTSDLGSFEQFSEYVHVDCGLDNYQTEIDQAFLEGKKVIAYLSLANGQLRQDRIDFLFGKSVSKMLIVDEADFGAWQSGQAEVLIEAIGTNVKTILMTGTNADRASTHWKIDHMVSCTYPELLIQKRETLEKIELCA